MKNFNGTMLFLDRADINTDEIIPAKYLTEISKEALKPYAMEDLKLEGFDARRDLADTQVIVSRANFGCGSSREHAPWALEVNGINLVIAPNFARIFRQNMFNCGMMAIELDSSAVDELFKRFAGKKAQLSMNFDKQDFTVSAGADKGNWQFRISDFDRDLVKAGGWVDYADSRY